MKTNTTSLRAEEYLNALHLAAQEVTNWIHYHTRSDYPAREVEAAFAFFAEARDNWNRVQAAKSIVIRCINPLTKGELAIAERKLINHAKNNER